MKGDEQRCMISSHLFLCLAGLRREGRDQSEGYSMKTLLIYIIINLTCSDFPVSGQKGNPAPGSAFPPHFCCPSFQCPSLVYGLIVSVCCRSTLLELEPAFLPQFMEPAAVGNTGAIKCGLFPYGMMLVRSNSHFHTLGLWPNMLSPACPGPYQGFHLCSLRAMRTSRRNLGPVVLSAKVKVRSIVGSEDGKEVRYLGSIAI